MPRRPRRDLPDGTYHVTARAVSGLSLFHDDEDCRAFLWLLGLVTADFQLTCRAYCLMGTHYHLVLHCRRASMSAAMRTLNGRYAQRFNERQGRSGHVFAQRYSAYVIRDEVHFEEVLAYIAANPVKAGMCMSVGDWPWTWTGDGSTPRARSVRRERQPRAASRLLDTTSAG
jgi:putative transposase